MKRSSVTRRFFLKQMGTLILFSACGKTDKNIDYINDKKLSFRFAVASDLHYGEPNTDWEQYTDLFADGFVTFNKENPCDMLFFNGDIIHNDPKFLEPAARELKKTHPRLYVTQGNHDRVSEEVWKNTWGIGFNYEIKHKDVVFLLGTTSNEIGSLLYPDINWFKEKLEKNKTAKSIFIMVHIYPFYNDRFSEEFKELLKQYRNVKAMFNGHDHDNEGVLFTEGIPCIFDGRVGGSWGTFDKQFRVIEYYDDNSFLTYLMTPYESKKKLTF